MTRPLGELRVAFLRRGRRRADRARDAVADARRAWRRPELLSSSAGHVQAGSRRGRCVSAKAQNIASTEVSSPRAVVLEERTSFRGEDPDSLFRLDLSWSVPTPAVASQSTRT